PAHSDCLVRSFDPGQHLLDRFEIIDFLGAGGLGEVYRAYDHSQGVFVALKTFRADILSDTAARTMLKNELNTARAITHPNICRLYDFHWSGGSKSVPFLTMELLHGETLAERLRRDGKIHLDQATPIIDGLLDALGAAHGRGIVHRDFKP